MATRASSRSRTPTITIFARRTTAGVGVDTSKDSKQQEAGTSLGVNAFLWRGALDTLSFMPLASADPWGGVIITDWYAPPTANGERFKATAYILGRQLRADGVRVTVFRQVRDGGQWEGRTGQPQHRFRY